MGERLVAVRQPSGNSIQRLRMFGWFLLAAGIVGQCVVVNKMLGKPDTETVMALLDTNPTPVIVSILTTLLGTCAVPLFAFLLVEGLRHTTSFPKYFLRVLALAVVCEIPFDLAMSDVLFDWNSQNPVLGIVLCMVLFYFFDHYKGKSFKTVAVAVLVTIMAFLWGGLLRIQDGQPLVLIFVALWFTRGKKGIQTLVGCVVTCLCSSLSVENLTYFAAPMVFLLIHFYNEELGESNKVLNYVAYPVMLLGIWLVAQFAV